LNVFKQLYLNHKKRSVPHGSLSRAARNIRTENQEYLTDLVEKRIEYVKMDNDLDSSAKVQKTKKYKL
jgi:hypothetical protein